MTIANTGVFFFPQGKRQALMFVVAVVLLVVSYLLLNYWLLTQIHAAIRSTTIRRIVVLTSMVVISGTLFVWVALFVRHKLRLVIMALFFLSSLSQHIYFRITQYHIDADTAEWLWSERNQLTNAVEEFLPKFIYSSVIVTSIFVLALTATYVALANRPRLNHRFFFQARKWGEPTGLAFLCLWGGALYVASPPQSPVEIGPLVAFISAWTSEEPDSDPVTLKPRSSDIHQIIVVMDESVRSDYFDKILKRDVISAGGIDFGRAMSISPCSAPSNAHVRWGIDPRDNKSLSRDPRHNPKIWGYGKVAGYQAFLFDGQSQGESNDYLGVKEKASLDFFAPLSDGLETDKKLATYVNRKVKTVERSISYIVKRGSHFPYTKNFPFGIIPVDSPLEVRYEEAIRFPNQEFFSRLTDGLDMTQTLIIYTSDHGQRLRQPGLPHCNPQPDFEEHAVPLVVITGNREWRDALIKSATESQNKASQYQIFSTILVAMGYDKDQVESRYYPSLLSENPGYYGVIHPYRPFPSIRNPVILIRRFTSFPYSRDSESEMNSQ